MREIVKSRDRSAQLIFIERRSGYDGPALADVIRFSLAETYSPRNAGGLQQCLRIRPLSQHSKLATLASPKGCARSRKVGTVNMTLEFKFHWVDEQGNAQGFLAKKGQLDNETLALDDTKIPVPAILEVEVRSDYLIFSVMTNEPEPGHLIIKTGKTKQLKAELGRLRSAAWAAAHREQLESEGQGHTFREVTCPSCAAVIDVTNMEKTPQISCGFCHTISTIDVTDAGEDPQPATIERGFQICDECGMYSKPRQFTIFYFYFLLVIYGYRYHTTWRCPGCMRGEAWKMLFGNLIFVLGVPVALVQLFRSYGGTDVGGLHSGLDGANLLARKGELERAVGSYRTILNQRPINAGVKYNIGLALLSQERHGDAARIFESALADCSNYQPAAIMLAACYDQLGETDKLQELKRLWGASDEAEENDSTEDPATTPSTESPSN